jgi:predicted phage replisome organizer
MKDGYLYSNILLKLYLKSLCRAGKLMVTDKIPYSPEVLAKVTGHEVGTIEKAVNLFREYGLLEIFDSGSIYMLDIQNYIGKSTTEADRKRNYRKRIEKDKRIEHKKKSGQMSGHSSLELELELEKDLDLDIDTKKDKHKKEEDLFLFWNSLINVIHHRNIKSHLSNITKQLKKDHNSDIEAVKNAMRVYDEVLGSDKVFFGHQYKWSLVDFLGRAIPKYLDKTIEDFYDSKYAKKVDVAKNGFGYNEVL